MFVCMCVTTVQFCLHVVHQTNFMWLIVLYTAIHFNVTESRLFSISLCFTFSCMCRSCAMQCCSVKVHSTFMCTSHYNKEDLIMATHLSQYWIVIRS